MTSESPRRQSARSRRMAEPSDAPEMDQLVEVEPVPAGATAQPELTPAASRAAPEPLALETPAPAPVQTPEPAAAPVASRHPRSMREMLARVDDGWRWFRAAAGAFPSERMDEHLGEGSWTRKQMVAHVAAWHDVTADRLGRMMTTGAAADLVDDTDAFNARIARQAVGRTAGEVLKDMEMTFNRLRRRLAQLTDEHLALDDAWAAQVIAGNTYEHYEEHRDDVYNNPPPSGRSGRR